MGLNSQDLLIMRIKCGEFSKMCCLTSLGEMTSSDDMKAAADVLLDMNNSDIDSLVKFACQCIVTPPPTTTPITPVNTPLTGCPTGLPPQGTATGTPTIPASTTPNPQPSGTPQTVPASTSTTTVTPQPASGATPNPATAQPASLSNLTAGGMAPLGPMTTQATAIETPAQIASAPGAAVTSAAATQEPVIAEMSNPGPVGNDTGVTFRAKDTGQLIRVIAHRGESASAAVARVRARHGG